MQNQKINDLKPDTLTLNLLIAPYIKLICLPSVVSIVAQFLYMSRAVKFCRKLIENTLKVK
jgi:hypothetical protein